ALKNLAESAVPAELRPATLLLLGLYLEAAGLKEDTLRFLHRAQASHPDDFWLNHRLGTSYLDAKPPRTEEAIRFLLMAVAVRTTSPCGRNSLGCALEAKGQVDEAITEYKEALLRKPDFAVAHYNLGHALHANGRLDDAIAEYKTALRLNPDY